MAEGQEVVHSVFGEALMKYKVVDVDKTMGRYMVLFIDIPLDVAVAMEGINLTDKWVWVSLDRWVGASGYAFRRNDGYLAPDYVAEKLNIRNKIDAEEITKIISEELNRKA